MTFLLKPDKNRKKFFDGLELQASSIKFNCPKCGSDVEQDLWVFVSLNGNWQRSGKGKNYGKIFGLDHSAEFLKSHDGRQAYIGELQCAECDATYLVYVGFNEAQPCRYIASLQGVYLTGS